METGEVIVTLVQQLGFPIACVCVLFYLLYRNMEYQKSHDAETAKLITENTAAISSLKDLIMQMHEAKSND